MTTENSREIDVERIFDRLREEIRKKEAGGGEGGGLDWYPEGEVSVSVGEMSGLNRFRHMLGELSENHDARIGVEIFSNRPYVGKLIVGAKKVVRRILRPYTNMILTRQTEFNTTLVALLSMLVSMEAIREAHDSLIKGMITQITSINKKLSEHLPKIDTLYYESLVFKNDLGGILEKIEKAGPSAPAPTSAASGVSKEREVMDGGAYYLFEGLHRGDPESIAKKQAGYVELFAGKDRILDVGCGRGEFLALLRERGIEALGVDSNRLMVESCKEKGLNVTCADLLDHLSEAEDDSFGGIFSSQVIEHLTESQIAALIRLARQKLETGGVVVLETLNPLSLVGFAEYFYKDPTHVTPVHPETLAFLLKSNGFKNVRTEFRSPTEEEKMLKKIPAAETRGDNEDYAILNENIEKLNSVLFGFQEYAVIAEK